MTQRQFSFYYAAAIAPCMLLYPGSASLYVQGNTHNDYLIKGKRITHEGNRTQNMSWAIYYARPDNLLHLRQTAHVLCNNQYTVSTGGFISRGAPEVRSSLDFHITDHTTTTLGTPNRDEVSPKPDPSGGYLSLRWGTPWQGWGTPLARSHGGYPRWDTPSMEYPPPHNTTTDGVLDTPRLVASCVHCLVSFVF